MLAIAIVLTKVDNTIAVMHKTVFNCSSANKSYQLQFCKQSCLLQLVHTKAIAASTQSCDFSNEAPTNVFLYHSRDNHYELLIDKPKIIYKEVNSETLFFRS